MNENETKEETNIEESSENKYSIIQNVMICFLLTDLILLFISMMVFLSTSFTKNDYVATLSIIVAWITFVIMIIYIAIDDIITECIKKKQIEINNIMFLAAATIFLIVPSCLLMIYIFDFSGDINNRTTENKIVSIVQPDCNDGYFTFTYADGSVDNFFLDQINREIKDGTIVKNTDEYQSEEVQTRVKYKYFYGLLTDTTIYIDKDAYDMFKQLCTETYEKESNCIYQAE